MVPPSSDKITTPATITHMPINLPVVTGSLNIKCAARKRPIMVSEKKMALATCNGTVLRLSVNR